MKKSTKPQNAPCWLSPIIQGGWDLATCFGVLREEVVLGMILDDSVDSIGRNLPIIAATDPDEDCRKIAGFVLSNVAKAMRSIDGSESLLTPISSTKKGTAIR